MHAVKSLAGINLSWTVCYLVSSPGGDCSLWLPPPTLPPPTLRCWWGGRREASCCEHRNSVGIPWLKQDLGCLELSTERIICLRMESGADRRSLESWVPLREDWGGEVTQPKAAVKAVGGVPFLICQGAPSSQFGAQGFGNTAVFQGVHTTPLWTRL